MSSINYYNPSSVPVPTLDQVLTAGNHSGRDIWLERTGSYLHMETTGITSHGDGASQQFMQMNPQFLVWSQDAGSIRMQPGSPLLTGVHNQMLKDASGLIQLDVPQIMSQSVTVTVTPGATSVVLSGLTGTPNNATVTPMSANAEGVFYISAYGLHTVTLKYAAPLAGGSTIYAVIYTH